MSTQDPDPPLVLASRSPRRQSLLHEAGYVFAVVPPDVDEDDHPHNLLPGELALYLARMKARWVSERRPTSTVLAADTVVAFGDRSLGQPANEADARRIITLLAGATHIVITGVVVMRQTDRLIQERRVMSAVRVRAMARGDIDRYIETGLWRGKAGGYGVQDGNPFIKGVVGCPTNVIGLPMSTTRQLLSAAGIEPVRPAVGG